MISKNQMQELAILGMGLGAMAIQKLDKLEKQLKESGVSSNDPKYYER